MTTIELVANDQLLQVTVNPTISSGEQNTVEVRVDFSDDWDGFSKSAVFFTSLNKNAIFEIVMTDGKCIVPAEVMEKSCTLFIGIRGVNSNNNEVKTTSLVKYKISEGTPTGNSTEVEPTPDVYQQLLTAYGKTDSAIAKEVVDRKSAISTEKAERQAEIAVERARIDNMSTLTEGSTTGDAELLDIRVKADGSTATSAGNAVREQVSELKSDISTVKNEMKNLESKENPTVEIGEDELFLIENEVWYFVEASTNTIGTHSGSAEFKLYFYDESKIQLYSKSIHAWDKGAYTLGDYGIFAVGNMNSLYSGNRILKIKVTDETVKYAKIVTAVESVPLKGIYKGMIPQEELDNVDVFNTYLDSANASDFERKMKNYSGKYKRFRGIYRRELDGDICLRVNTPYGYAEGNNEATHIYDYYDTAGDYLLYLYDTPTSLDDGVASKGDIVYFDGALLRVEKNPFWKDGNVRHHDHYDICIVGGGSAGFATAYALKNSGYKVCLVEMLDSLGGTNLNGGIIRQIASPIGDWYKELCKKEYSNLGFTFNTSDYSIGSDDTTETDFDKLWRGSMVNYGISNLGNLCTLNPYRFRQVYEEEIADTVDILYNRRVIDSKVVDTKIIYAVFENMITGGKETISAEYFVDCTADLYLLRCNKTLGEDFFVGSDGDTLYSESAYNSGATANKYEINTLEQGYLINTPSSYVWCNANNRKKRIVKDYTNFPSDSSVGNNINGIYDIPLVDSAYFDYQSDLRHVNIYGLKYGNMISPGIYAKLDGQKFIDEGYDYTRAVGVRKAMSHAKVRNYIYSSAHPMLAIREGYRMKCDYMLTQTDIETTITSADLSDKHIIALSSWYCDIHNPETLDTSKVTPTWLNGIPYEALIPSCYTNALVACRGLGASHVGISAYRLTRTMLAVGYAAGKAIKQARAGWLDDVRDIDIATLQEEIEIAKLLEDIETNILTSE